MALLGSLNTGASGVRTQGKTMQIVGNNIANVNTFGFKSNQVAFEDLMGNSWPQGSAFTKASNGRENWWCVNGLFTGCISNHNSQH